MAYNDLKGVVGNEPIWIVEMDMDFCSLRFGVGACTAVGAVGTECFNTKATTQDAANYDGGGANVFTHRYSQTSINTPPTINALPLIKSVAIAQTEISRGQGLGPRGKVSITFSDTPHDDLGGFEGGVQQNPDPYVLTRPYDPMTQGTYWPKWLARNPFFVGRVIRIRSGFVTEPWDWANFITRTYIIESISGPSNNQVTVVAKDVLKLADDDRSTAPVASRGYLAADISAVAATISLLPAGIVASEYPTPGATVPETVIIGTEIMTYTGVAGDDLTGVVRGSDGTTGATHSADDVVQLCLRLDTTTGYSRFDDAAELLLETYAFVPAAYIPKPDWVVQTDDWLSGIVIDKLIIKPTSVKKLIGEMCNVFMADMWWDPVDSEIKVWILQPARGTPDELSDNAEVLGGTFGIVEKPEQRKTRIEVHYDLRDHTKSLTDPTNYRRSYFTIDAVKEGATEFGDVRQETFYNSWTRGAGDSLRLADRTLLALGDGQNIYGWRMKVDNDYDLTNVVTLNVHNLQDATGARNPTDAYIVSKHEVRAANEFAYKARKDVFSGRYAFIGPDTLGVYTAESDANKKFYAFISADADPWFADGTEYYRII